MDNDYIHQHVVIDRYLQGTLAEGELAEFEERLTWDHELIEEIELAETLREGLKAAVEDSEYTTRASDRGYFDRLVHQFTVPQYAAAASFLVGIMMGAVLLSPGTDPTGSVETRTEIVPLVVVRGSSGPTVSVDEAAWTVLLVDAPADYDVYRVTITRDGVTDPFWIQDDLVLTYPGALAVGMVGAVLSPGNYVLRLYGTRISDTGDRSYEFIQDIPFETVAPE